MIKIFKHLESKRESWFFIVTFVVFFLLRLPSFFEPLWYGDEGIYEVIGFALNKGRGLYTGIWDNKPPMLYLTYAIFYGNQALVRVFSFLVGLLTIFVFFFLAKKLFAPHDKKDKASFITTGLF